MKSESIISLTQEANDFHTALDAYVAAVVKGGTPERVHAARTQVERTMDAYEAAAEAQAGSLHHRLNDRLNDPRHVRPLRGETKAL